MLYSGTAVLAQEMVAELAKQLAGEQEGPWGERGLCLLPRPPRSAPGESNSRGERPWGRSECGIVFCQEPDAPLSATRHRPMQKVLGDRGHSIGETKPRRPREE